MYVSHLSCQTHCHALLDIFADSCTMDVSTNWNFGISSTFLYIILLFIHAHNISTVWDIFVCNNNIKGKFWGSQWREGGKLQGRKVYFLQVCKCSSNKPSLSSNNIQCLITDENVYIYFQATAYKCQCYKKLIKTFKWKYHLNNLKQHERLIDAKNAR